MAFKVGKHHESKEETRPDPFQIIVRGDLQEVVNMVNSGENLNRIRWSGFSLLHRAAQMGYTDVCQILIDNGADVNMTSVKGWFTPLHCALANGFVETGEYLIKRGAKPWVKDKYKDDPFDYGAKKGFKAICSDLRNKVVKLEMAQSIQRHNELLSESQRRK